MEEHNKKENKLKFKIMIVIFILIILVCIGYLIYQKNSSSKNQNLYDDIAVESNTSGKTKNVAKIADLQKENTDVVGWIKINDTMIDYPILQTTDNEYYLKHNYKKEETKYGSIYFHKDSNIEDVNSNIIIYGHNMKDNQMFNTLLKYENEDFYNEHKTINIATEQEENQYEIVSVFKSRVFYQDEKDVFRYYNYTSFEDEQTYNEFIDNCKKIQMYDTGVSAGYGEQLITLITCEYSQENGRMVVVAKKID